MISTTVLVRSMAELILRVAVHVTNSLNLRWDTAAVFLDIQQMLDRVWREGLIPKLIQILVSDFLINVIESVLANRTFHVRMGKTPWDSADRLGHYSRFHPVTIIVYSIFSADISTLKWLSQWADDIALIRLNKTIWNVAGPLLEHLIALKM